MKKDRKPDEVFIASNGVKVNIYGKMDVEALARSMFGFKQKVNKTEKKGEVLNGRGET